MGTLTLKKKDEIETKFDKSLGTIQCFLDQTCKETAGGRPLKDQLQGQESDTKFYSLPLLYITKLEEGSFNVNGYVKSMEPIWKRFNDVNMNVPEELVILMTLVGLLSSFETQ